MDENEFTINPKQIRSQRKSRRNTPPGQTRHTYADSIEDDTFFEVDVDDDNTHLGTAPRPNRPKSSKRRPPEEKAPLLVRVFFDRRVIIWLGLICILVSVATVVVLLSHLKNGALDQAVILNMSAQEIADSGIKTHSAIGPLGSWLGHVLFARALGVGAFVIAIYFFVLGWRLLFEKEIQFWGMTFRYGLLAIASSVIVGLVTYSSASKIFWGGVHGHYINKWLITMTGLPGALFIALLFGATVFAVYFFEFRHHYIRYKNYLVRKRNERIERQNAIRTQRQKELDNNRLAMEADENIIIHKPAPKAKDQIEIKHKDHDNETDAFVIDQTPSAPAHQNISTDTDNHESTVEFQIDVPKIETGRNTGSVAERLVAEQGEIDPRAELSRFRFPTLDMLENRPIKVTADTEEQEANQERIIKTLGNYGITIESIKATVGPTVTLYEIVPTEGVRIANIKRLEADIALSLAAKGIRIIAPMPGKGTVGIEVPNREPQVVTMRTILASKKFRESKAKLPVALGATISNEIFVTDLAAMPHALVAGATGQGKSVGLNVLITSLLYRKHPTELKFVLIDPKMVEFSVYERLRGHYLASLPGEEDAIVTDPSKVLGVLNSLCIEMDNRYALLRNAAVNKIEDYNRKYCQRRLSAEKGHKYLPYIVVIIDEFADLIMTGGKEIEMPVMRITQKARAVGIHMIIATQRPSTNVLTGLIKANCPSRIAFRVNQLVDSRTILDRPGAEHLIGRGDMLYSQGGEMERMQCAFISSDEVERICDSIDSQTGFECPYPLPEPVSEGPGLPSGGSLPGGGLDRDPLFDEAARFVVLSSTASTSSLQRRFEIGYNRAGKIMDQMEACGIVGPASGSKPRSVLVDPDTLEHILANR